MAHIVLKGCGDDVVSLLITSDTEVGFFRIGFNNRNINKNSFFLAIHPNNGHVFRIQLLSAFVYTLSELAVFRFV
ncbi:hypothetical protein BRD20_10680 [Halobacteriales archaeon SW_8_65_20]|nr:MAG: hypothetical protein BRC71_04185 [Halobacteriales archaeon QH_7_65_31]PSQ51396.1 MAG: hypothetical protein BRD20_10680 [Halobacteriales archaeon SW_8_65_20]